MRINGSSIFNRRAWLVLILALSVSPALAQTKTKINPKDGLTYVWIPPGTFQMGCSPEDSECLPDEKPTHSITIAKGLWIGQTPVTQAAYKKVVDANPRNFKRLANPTNFERDQWPIDSVPWDDAQEYCAGADMRLPTEAEWEYAARGGSAAARYAPLASIAWYDANSGGETHEVAQKQANAYGLYDMLGNVWEWVADWYGPYDGASAVDPKGPPTGQGRVLRGGSFHLGGSVARVSYRGWGGVVPGDLVNDYVGFRCAGD